MIIEKAATKKDNFVSHNYYYDSARAAMFDLVSNMCISGLIDTLFLPGYIGLSPKEGSGIFDPVNRIEELKLKYYKMTSNLDIDFYDLIYKMRELKSEKFAVLVVNYFGFVDPRIEELTIEIKKKSGWIIEDNAHGFFTYQYYKQSMADATFFSLHKMFPFERGGSLSILNEQLNGLGYCGNSLQNTVYNPWVYDIQKIARLRRENYEELEKIIKDKKYLHLFRPLKESKDHGIIPHTFPICIIHGDRNKIYTLMNEKGFGVVSLYHTLIEPLRTNEFRASLDLSRQILNLPVHQDVDRSHYEEMVALLAKYCESTAN